MLRFLSGSGSCSLLKSSESIFSVAMRFHTRVEERTEQVALNQLQGAPGSRIKKQRVGRGGKRGGSSGRGNGGQKHHGKRPAPWFTGLYTNPLIEALPRFPYAAQRAQLLGRTLEQRQQYQETGDWGLEKRYKILPLDRLQHWLDTGRLSVDNGVITIRDMVECGLIRGSVWDGVKLLGNGSEYFCAKNVCIEVTRASQSAIHTIERLGGRVTCVFHTRQGIKQLVNQPRSVSEAAQTKSEKYLVQAPFEPPVTESDIEYYTSHIWRGYLSPENQELFEKEFKQRGYLSLYDHQKAKLDNNEEKELEPVRVYQKYTLASPEELANTLDQLTKQRAYRQFLVDEEEKKEQSEVEAQEKAWNAQRWFPGQGDYSWVELVQGADGSTKQVRSNFTRFNNQEEDEQYEDEGTTMAGSPQAQDVDGSQSDDNTDTEAETKAISSSN